jgi:hypothetical protein
VQLSPAERERRRQLALRLHREGRLGGRGPARESAELRARRGSELSAEIVAKHRAKIENAILVGLKWKSTAQRLKAAELAVKMGFSAERIDGTCERTEREHASREELLMRWSVASL